MRMQILLIGLLTLPMVAAMQIDMAYYDALNEAGSEFVVLRNDGAEEVNLTGWKLHTKSSASDATLSGAVAAGDDYLVADAGWETSKDDPSWPPADHEEILNLYNSDAFIALVDDEGNTHSIVGYGDTNMTEGSPHPGAPEGQALIRTSSTGDNSADFIAQTPTFMDSGTNDTEPEQTNVSVTVNDVPTEIISWSIDDDDPSQGVQLLPIPGAERTVTVNLTIRDNNTLADTTVTVNGEQAPLTENLTVQDVSVQVPITTSTSSVTIETNDGTTLTIPIELLAVVGVSIPENMDLTVTPGTVESRTLLVENTGTTNLSVQVKGARPRLADKLLGEISYSLLGQWFPLEEAFRHHDIDLAPGDTAAIDLNITSGYVPQGTYTGQIMIAGVAR